MICKFHGKFEDVCGECVYRAHYVREPEVIMEKPKRKTGKFLLTTIFIIGALFVAANMFGGWREILARISEGAERFTAGKKAEDKEIEDKTDKEEPQEEPREEQPEDARPTPSPTEKPAENAKPTHVLGEKHQIF